MGRINYITTDYSYYSTGYAGYYQFVTLQELVANFMIAYVGEDKLISKVSPIDVEFHTKRALMELSYDVLLSTKSWEMTVPPSLKDVLPHDYINYTKVVRVDSSGIEHPIYPTNKTSNPQFQGNIVGSHDESHFTYNADSWTFDTDNEGDTFTWSDNYKFNSGAIIGGSVNNSGTNTSTVAQGIQMKLPLPDLKNGKVYAIRFSTSKLRYNATAQGKFKVMLFGDKGDRWTHGYERGVKDYTPFAVGAGDTSATMRLDYTSTYYQKLTTAHGDYDNERCLIIEVVDETWVGLLERVIITQRTDGRTYPTYQNNLGTGGSIDSTTWSNYKGTTPSENNNDDYEDDTYWPHNGQRYGLDPQHAHTNGSYYIDPLTNFIHFSSNLSGETVILKYITDSMSSDNQAVVHKFAEEAMYKCIMYAILSTRANVPARQLMMLKKERRAAMRQAKLRLSNIKLEEITQVLRGKSKQIKH